MGLVVMRGDSAGHRYGRLLYPVSDTASAATVYHPSSLLVTRPDGVLLRRVQQAVSAIAAQVGFEVEAIGCRLQFTARHPDSRPPDPWWLLEAMRRAGRGEEADALALNHVMSMAEQVGGNPLALGRGRPGLDRYGAPGYGSRGPVDIAVPRPVVVAVPRRPRVVVLDTGIGEHPWLVPQVVSDTVSLAGGGVIGPQIDPGAIRYPLADSAGLVPDRLLGSLGTHSGHGTFIAGLLHQRCPSAQIVALAVMGADGIVDEHVLTDALAALLAKQREEPGWADALVLALGYYAETGEDLVYTSRLRTLMLELGRAGVAVFCAAGNDATTSPSYPAAFAADPEFDDPEVVPLLSVAATNPDGTIAAFSNDGDWVSAQALGVNLVSTTPKNADGSGRPAVRAPGYRGRRRAMADPDNLAAGFACWSGTSFAAPVLAGEYLRQLTRVPLPWTIADRRRLARAAARPRYAERVVTVPQVSLATMIDSSKGEGLLRVTHAEPSRTAAKGHS